MKFCVSGCYWSKDQFRNRGIKLRHFPPEPQPPENHSLLRSRSKEPTLLCNQVKFYKGRSQEKNLPLGRRFSSFAAHLIEQDLF